MNLCTLESGARDGRLALVNRSGTRAVFAAPIADTLLDALDRWAEAEPELRRLADDLEQGRADSFAFDSAQALAPLPRTWQWLDGSAFDTHSALLRRAAGRPLFELAEPLMYQGVSAQFYSPASDIPFAAEDAIDFEAEFGVVVDDVPMGVSAAQAAGHIKLLLLINDWSLRGHAAKEMKIGFGWIHAKPPCSMAPIAVTPDEIGAAWRDCRVDLPALVDWNGERFGAANGYEMSSSFADLIVHAARTRPLQAGTVIGSGTVSNADFKTVGSSCIAERRAIETIEAGAPSTRFMTFGDRVRMESIGPDGRSYFGAVDQTVVRAAPARN